MDEGEVYAGAVPGASSRASSELPLEPLYNTAVVVEIVPFPNVAALRFFLSKHRDEFPQRYKKCGYNYHRMFTGAEVRRMREMVIINGSVGIGNPGRSGRSRAGLFDAIARRAANG